MVLECWPNGTDFTAAPPPKQFNGWPIEIDLISLTVTPAASNH